MWLDAEVEDAYAKAFGFEGKDKVVVLNPGKRKRFVAHDEDISFSALKRTLESITSGNSRFTRVELGQFSLRK